MTEVKIVDLLDNIALGKGAFVRLERTVTGAFAMEGSFDWPGFNDPNADEDDINGPDGNGHNGGGAQDDGKNPKGDGDVTVDDDGDTGGGNPPNPNTGPGEPPAPPTGNPGPTTPPGDKDPDEVPVVLPPGADPNDPLTYLVNGRLITIYYNGQVLRTYLIDADEWALNGLSNFYIWLYTSDGTLVPTPPAPVVLGDPPVGGWTYDVYALNWTYPVGWFNTGPLNTQRPWGPDICIMDDDSVVCQFEISDDTIRAARLVFRFGYENQTIGFNDAVIIWEAGYGRYLVPVLD